VPDLSPAERGALSDALAAAAASGPGALVVVGDARAGAGIAASAEADGWTALRIAADERERNLPFATLITLLHAADIGAGDGRAPLPSALAAMRDRAEPASTARLGLELLTLLTRWTDAEPTLIAIDDAQWIDDASREVLLFAWRRLHDAPAVLVACADTAPEPWLEAAAIVTVAAPGAPSAAAGGGVPPADLARRVWHLDATREPVQLDEIEEVARRAAQAGAHLAAVDAWRYAATLTPERAAANLLAAGSAAWDAGRPDIAAPLLEAARARAGADLAVRAAATDLLGQVLGWTTSAAHATELLEREARELEALAPDAAAAHYLSATRIATLAASSRAVALGDRAETLATDPALRAGAAAMAGHARLLAMASDADQPARLAQLAAIGAMAGGAAPRSVLEAGQLAGFREMVEEDWGGARRTFDAVAEASRSRSLHGIAAFASAMRAEVDWRASHWSHARAGALGELGFQSTIEGQRGSWGDATLARVEAALGHVEQARAHADRAVMQADARGLDALGAWGRHAVALAGLAAARPDDALSPLAWIADVAERGGARDPGILWWHGDALEALLATGDRAGARRLVDRLDAQARVLPGRVWPRAIALRGRGLLDADPAPLEESARLLAIAPFEAARSLLSLAEVLGGAGGEGTDAATAATATFERLGAQPWTQRARALSGGADAATPVPASALLTPGELRVALAVAEGETNREVAERLALSPRTVDAHLQSIYRKLRVRTRTQLALRIAAR